MAHRANFGWSNFRWVFVRKNIQGGTQEDREAYAKAKASSDDYDVEVPNHLPYTISFQVKVMNLFFFRWVCCCTYTCFFMCVVEQRDTMVSIPK